MASASESHVDVLIIGAGPAGLMMATWMAKCGIRTRIVDKRGTAVFTGQADGLACRTLEILDSLGFGHRAWRESNHMLEFCMWNPDAAGVLRRSDRLPDTTPGLSRFQQAVLHQGRIERFFLDEIEARSDIRVERGVLPTSLAIDETAVDDPNAYPVTVTLRRLTEEEATPKQQQQQQQQQQATTDGQHPVQDGLFRSNLTKDDTEDLLAAGGGAEEETVHARYLLGADGAHSWTRKQLGVALQGESTDSVWGVLDMVPVTDFPDIRMRCAIHSAAAGSIMIIPRENKLVRVYVQLSAGAAAADAAPGRRADRSGITPEAILAEAQRIMAPYSITYRKLDWWTAYQIGQRVGTKFSVHERVFLAGDAVHTHSPKAGQGMNVSMQDTFNLGWKVASVLKGQASRSILRTYESERRKVAQDLIAFDRDFSRLFFGRPAKDDADTEGVRMADFKAAFARSRLFTSGTVADYGPSAIVAKPAAAAGGGGSRGSGVISEQRLAPGIPVGVRIPSVKVLSQADARPWHLQELLPSDGRWRVLVLPGDVRSAASAAAARLRAVADHFAARDAFPARFTAPDAPPDAVFELLVVHAAPRAAVTVFDFPPVFRRFSDADGYDYGKIYVDDASYHEGHGRLYAEFGIAEEGCLVVVRPDQHVAYVGSMGEPEAVTEFFAGFMIPQMQ